jgi:hypothetical protein
MSSGAGASIAPRGRSSGAARSTDEAARYRDGKLAEPVKRLRPNEISVPANPIGRPRLSNFGGCCVLGGARNALGRSGSGAAYTHAGPAEVLRDAR